VVDGQTISARVRVAIPSEFDESDPEVPDWIVGGQHPQILAAVAKAGEDHFLPLGKAMEALMALTPHERGLVLCWFCDACHEYVGPGDDHRCTQGSELYPSADEAKP